MRGTPATNGDVAFDSFLILHKGSENHTLTLVLKIYLRQMLPQSSPKGSVAPILAGSKDFRVFLIKPWQPAEWAKFLKGFKHECAKWNKHFWLIPPKDFWKLDMTTAQRSVRSNIYCHLEVDVVGDPAGSHRTIEVVNIEKKDAGTFRASDRRYSPYDVGTTNPGTTRDAQGNPQTARNYSTIVHEIGHAIGLPHIGMTHRDPLCHMAVLFDMLPASGPVFPAVFKGGINADVCYGTLGLPKRWQNVMGGGSTFEESNAAPWAKRLALHTGTRPEDWHVSMKRVAPVPLQLGKAPTTYKVGQDSTYITN
jgi:hypothetical protein